MSLKDTMANLSGGKIAGIVIAHLIPFYLCDRAWIVAGLAAVGIVVNTATLMFVDPTLLLFVFGTGLSFLLNVITTCAYHCEKPCMLTSFRSALKSGGMITCKPLQMHF